MGEREITFDSSKKTYCLNTHKSFFSSRIPLVPRRPVSPDPDAKAAGAGKDKKDKKPGKKDDGGPESPAPPMDPDEKLLYDGFQSGTNALATIVSCLHHAYIIHNGNNSGNEI